MSNLQSYSVINKEDISQLKFSNSETLSSKQKRSLRSHYLYRASILGNIAKNKVKIYFKDNKDRLHRVNTTIWALTTDFVVLKQGVTIPRKSIVFVD